MKKFKKNVLILLTVLLTVCCLSFFACDTNIGNENEDEKYNEYNNAYYLGDKDNPYQVLVKAKNTDIATCFVHSGTEKISERAFSDCINLTNVVIPINVTWIGDEAFENCSAMRSIIIPDSVTTIGKKAFSGCTNLASITIGTGTTSIGEMAFSDCNKLVEVINKSSLNIFVKNAINLKTKGTSDIINVNDYLFITNSNNKHYLFDYVGNDTVLTLPDSYKNENYELYNDVFRDHSNLKSIIIPDSITSIGDNTFYNCYNLISITIPDSVTTIGANAFYGCSSLISVTIPDSVATIGDNAFRNCSGLTNATVSGNIVSIGDNVFRDCSNLKNVTIKNGITAIGKLMFTNCYSLTNVTIPDSVTVIGTSAFYGCSSLTNVTIPDGVTTIGVSAFYGCYSLMSVTIPHSVTSIGNTAFKECHNLLVVINESSLDIIQGDINNGYVAYYAVIVNPESTNDIIVNVNDYLFYTCDNVNYLVRYIGNDSKLNLPNSYNGQNYVICQYAFSKCSNLQSIVIPDRVTSIEDNAFAQCSNLTSITIPNSVTSLGKYAFMLCENLKYTYITDIAAWCNIEFDNEYANPLFYACNLYLNNKLITDLTIPDTVTVIKDYAFFNATCLKGVKISDSVTSIGNSTFYDCLVENATMSATAIPYINKTKLKTVTITSGTTICERAFLNCSSLQSITFANSVNSINDAAFSGCSSLTNINISDNVTSIGDSAFYGCESLETINIPDSVISIGSYAFCLCTNLTNVIIGADVTSIGMFAFYNCDALTSVIFDDTTTWYCTKSSSEWAAKDGGLKISVKDVAANASYFKFDYCNYFWYKV